MWSMITWLMMWKCYLHPLISNTYQINRQYMHACIKSFSFYSLCHCHGWLMESALERWKVLAGCFFRTLLSLFKWMRWLSNCLLNTLHKKCGHCEGKGWPIKEMIGCSWKELWIGTWQQFCIHLSLGQFCMVTDHKALCVWWSSKWLFWYKCCCLQLDNSCECP